MSTATVAFDPYREWLGIEPHEQPADFYRLLGVARFEADLGRLTMAADQRMALVRSFQTGPRMHTQRLLNELAAARIALLTPASKAAYDAALAQHLSARIAPSPVAIQPTYGAMPAVLTFGLGQTAIPPAPPVLPPAAPAAPIARLHVEAPEDEPPVPVRSAPWWLPLVVMIVVPLLILAAVVGYSLNKPYFDEQFADTSAGEAPAAEGETTPEPEPRQSPPKAIVLLQEGSGEVVFSPATAALSGAVQLETSGTEELLVNWSTADDAAEWHFKLVKPGFFRAEIGYATIPEAAGAGLELSIGDRTTAVSLRSSGGLDQFITDTETVVVSSTGEQTLTIRPVRAPDGPWLVLRSVRLIPPDRPAPMSEPQP